MCLSFNIFITFGAVYILSQEKLYFWWFNKMIQFLQSWCQNEIFLRAAVLSLCVVQNAFHWALKGSPTWLICDRELIAEIKWADENAKDPTKSGKLEFIL